MKTSELTGESLDVWVAQAELAFMVGMPINDDTMAQIASKLGDLPYSPSTNWAQGGPIIERELIHVTPFLAGWSGHIDKTEATLIAPCGPTEIGPTPLIAAMRCYVASKYGEEVPDA